MASLHFSPDSYCDGVMPRADRRSLGRAAQHSINYACAARGRERLSSHDLTPARYGTW